MYAIVWTYRVHSDCINLFIESYSSVGAWAQLFQRNQGFKSTELLQRSSSENCFMTIDRWESKAAFERFFEEHKEEYESLDKCFCMFTSYEERIGTFEDEATISDFVIKWINKQ